MRSDLVGWCFSLLIGAVAVYVAVRLIETVWLVLLVIATVCSVAVSGVALLRRRHRGW